MKIVLLVAGSGGGFYCENCLRDMDWVRVLRRRGHDVLAAPVYLPVSMEGPISETNVPVFFGGVSVYMRERFPWFRKAPPWMTRWLDAEWVLRLAARKSGTTRASGLGSLTLSMLKGQDGHHASEVARLVEWLRADGKPDVIALSTLLLAGLAGPLRRLLDVPVVGFAQDEDVWLDSLESPYNVRCWDALRDTTGDLEAILAVSKTYASFAARRLDLHDGKVCCIYPGIDPSVYRPAHPEAGPPTVGYLSKMTESLGLGTLVDAVIRLKHAEGVENVRLRAMGGLTGGDHAFVAGLRRRLAAAGMPDAAEFLPGVDRERRIAFIEGLTVMSVPMPNGEAFGTFILESLAAGVPVVLPHAGGFPEVLAATGGGVLYPPDDVSALTDALARLLKDRARAVALGQQGKQAVCNRFTVDRMATDLEQLFRALATRTP